MTNYGHIVEGETGPRGGKVWCNMASDKKDGVMDFIDQKAKAEVARLGWTGVELRTALEAWFEADWPQMTPPQKQEAVDMMGKEVANG